VHSSLDNGLMHFPLTGELTPQPINSKVSIYIIKDVKPNLKEIHSMMSLLQKCLPYLPSYVAFRLVWRYIGKVEGWLFGGQERWLFDQARMLRNGARILEIGSYKGRSTICLALGCIGTSKHVFALDRWQGVYDDIEDSKALRDEFDEGFFDLFWKENIVASGMDDIVTPLAGDFSAIAKIWRAPIDMIFIDGSHTFESVISDFNNFFPYVVPGGLMAFHDVSSDSVKYPGCWKAWQEIISPQLVNHGFCASLAYGYKPCVGK
jgi:Methyltransferase domain